MCGGFDTVCWDYIMKFYVVRTVHFGMKLYNDQRNAQVFNLFIYLLLPYMFRLSIIPFSEAGVQLRQWFKSPGYGVSARDSCTPASEDVLTKSPKRIRQK